MSGPGDDLSSLTERLSDSFGCLPDDFSPLHTVPERRKRQATSQSLADLKCPRDSFCYIYTAYAIKGCMVKAYGYCCPHTCPIGLPHPTASCEVGAPHACNDKEGYFCSRTYLTESSIKYFGKRIDRHFTATCCPSHCPKGFIALSDGYCIPRVNFGESCWRDEQCPRSVSCLQGSCQCRAFEKPVFKPGVSYQTCV